MNLIIDIGNTRTKLAYFEGNKMVELISIDSNKFDLSHSIVQENFSSIIISSVKNIANLEYPNLNLFFFDETSLLPILNNYKIETLGMDRVAAAVGALELFPNNDCLIIDLGSAITIDLLTKEKVFEGGNISAGMRFRFSALHNFTDKLPLVNENGEVKLTAQDTKTAIRSGVVNSIVHEINGYIDAYEKNYPKIKVILTGGDSNFFAKQLKKRIFADENLVLKGLNRILNYNVDKK